MEHISGRQPLHKSIIAPLLGVLAGTPVELTIIALRRKTVEVEVEAPTLPAIGDPNMRTPVRRAPIETPPVPQAVVAPTPAVTPEAVVSTPTPQPTPVPIIETSIQEIELPLIEEETAQGTYVQVATLQDRARAEAVVAKLITAGLDAGIRERQTETKTLYRIIVGPANSPEALEIMMSVVQELGYKDAIVLG